MKKKLPIIRAALEAGLTLSFSTREMGDLMSALDEDESLQPWEAVENSLPCFCFYAAGFFFLEGIDKMEGAES